MLSKDFEKVYRNEFPSIDFNLYLEDCNAVEIFNVIASLKEKKIADIVEHCKFILK